jgi:hypothetical protein
MGQVTGTVSATNDNYGKVNIQVNGGWYSTKKEWWKGEEPSVGDEVSFDDGGKNYIKYFKITGKGSGSAAPSGGASGGAKAPVGGRTFPVAPLAPERTINRQNALTNAVKYFEGRQEASKEAVVSVARYFEAYTTGDLDAQEAEAQANAMFEGMQA